MSLQRDNSTPDGSVKGLCYRHTCHTLSRLQSGNSRNCRPSNNPYISCSSSADWKEGVTALPTITISEDPSLLLHSPLPPSTMSKSPPLKCRETTRHSHSTDTCHKLHGTGSHPARTKIESLTDTAFSAPLGK